MSGHERDAGGGRRWFVRWLATAGLGGLLWRGAREEGGPPERRPSEAASRPRARGYRETAHVRRYYDSARI